MASSAAMEMVLTALWLYLRWVMNRWPYNEKAVIEPAHRLEAVSDLITTPETIDLPTQNSNHEAPVAHDLNPHPCPFLLEYALGDLV